MTPLEEPGFKIMVATRPIDFRRGHDGLAAYAQMALDFAPTQGLVLVFRARRSDRLKILYWDSNGIVMSYKRLEVGNFVWPYLPCSECRRSMIDNQDRLIIVAASLGEARLQSA